MGRHRKPWTQGQSLGSKKVHDKRSWESPNFTGRKQAMKTPQPQTWATVEGNQNMTPQNMPL